MKTKILSTIIAIIAIFTVFTVAYADNVAVIEPESASDEVVDGAIEFDESKFGDINKDGKITASDARLILRVAANLEENSSYILMYGDYNKDGQITASDARTALRVAADLEDIECVLRGHNLTEYTAVPTCTEAGYTAQKCSRCNYETNEKTNIIDATGHDMQIISTKEVSCLFNGYTEHECSVCGFAEKDVIGAKGHDMKLVKNVKGTCISDGYTEYKCSVCGTIEKRDVIEASGHKYEYISKEGINIEGIGYLKKATKKCSNCNNVIETYDKGIGNTQVPATVIHSDEAYAIKEKYGVAYFIEGTDITGTKLVIYGNLDGIDIDGYYYKLDGTLKGPCPHCGTTLGEGKGMCDGGCHLSWG